MSDNRPTVVILLSDKRSGSTIFQSEFTTHPDVRGLDYSSHTYLESHHWLKAAVIKGMPPRFFSGNETYRNYGSIRNARTYMIDTIVGNVPDFVSPDDDADLIYDGWEALCRQFATPIFFEKSPQVLAHWAALSVLLDWMKRTTFDVKLVGLVRNPLAVQHSSKLLFGSPPYDRQFAWAAIYRNLLALRELLPEDKLMILRHEDILSDPGATMGAAFRFVGLEPFEGMGSNITSATQDRWRTDPDYKLALDESVKQIARGFGYTEQDLDNPNGDASYVTVGKSAGFRQSLSEVKNRLLNRHLRPAKLRAKLRKSGVKL